MDYLTTALSKALSSLHQLQQATTTRITATNTTSNTTSPINIHNQALDLLNDLSELINEGLELY
ncbi:hypothetical protein QC764_0075320 [Podospora pseudoanserina]|uniref:Uncharacterized protein n=1 Tax=Podospora pseudoanserina TaxID=2609844 RepID=A0ABR0I4P5_9PEZI|nr:hypothetical protein QC764_0075320 [Podospora pseudoanserina]